MVIIHQDKFGNEVEVISDRTRFWYVKNKKTGKRFTINKNELTCIEQLSTSSSKENRARETKK